jgi:hypothetical protein
MVVRRRRSNPRIGGFIGIENKFYDTEMAATNINASWAVYNPSTVDSLSVPAQGDGESNRDGKMFAITSLHVKGAVFTGGTEAQSAPEDQHRFRVIIYQDTQTNGAEASANDIMDVGGTDDTLAFRNLQYSKRFKVLYDRVFVTTPQITSEASNIFSAGKAIRNFQFNKKFKTPIKVTCNATSAGVSSCVDNNFGIAAIADSASNVSLQYQARIRFVG